ncbi:hypothetical protein K474DRAFT_1479082 [Panus rudis PR-1116 ss-1]|nr:hypothetical protein K474DRAFT_1479082 [Panus rudis PR-1116 ss-1]
MAPPSDHPAFHLQVAAGTFYVKQFKPDEPIPQAFLDILTNRANPSTLISITRTKEEISIAGEAGDGYPVAVDDPDATWGCIKIAGPMDFGVTGVIASFTAPLKAAAIPVFAISTWNTDYVLIPKEKLCEADTALANNGWKV